MQACFLLFCVNPSIEQEITRSDDFTLVTRIDPARSDFDYGRSVWQLAKVGGGNTRVLLHAVMVPSFWVPPVIGPWVLKRKLRLMAVEAGEQLERLAGGEQRVQ